MLGLCFLFVPSPSSDSEDEGEEQEECDRDELAEPPDEEEDTQLAESQVARLSCFPSNVATAVSGPVE